VAHEQESFARPEITDRAFEELWTANEKLMKRYCAKWASHRADEAFSKATFVAFSKFAQCRTSSTSWLMRVTRNVCIDLHREDAKVEQLDGDETAGEVSLAMATRIDPERALLAREQTMIVFRCLAALPARLREPLLLHAMLSFDHARIADTLSITNVCVRKRISEARVKLRDCIRGAPAARRIVSTATAGDDWWLKGETLAREVAERAADTTVLPPPQATSVVSVRRADGSERDVTLFHGTAPGPMTAGRIEQLSRYVERHPAGYVKAGELARLLRAEGRFDEAVPHYARVLARRGDLTALAFELADVHRVLGEPDMAAGVLERARLRSREIDAPLVEAQLARYSGRHTSAATILRTELQHNATRGDLWLLLGETSLECGDVAEAGAAFEQALSLRRGDPRALIGSHDALLAAGAPRAALARALLILDEDPSNPAALLRVAAAGFTSGSAATGELLERAAEFAPEAGATHALLASDAARMGGLEAGRAVMERFLHRHPAHVDAWLARARMLAMYGQPARAAAAARLVLVFAQHPADSDVRIGAAGVLATNGDDGAWRAEIGSIAPLRTNFRLMLAASHELADVRGALDLLGAVTNAAVFLQPHVAPSWSARARVLAAQHEATAAAEALAAALARFAPLEMTGDAVAAALELADEFRALQQDAQARTWTSTALRLARRLRPIDEATALAYAGIACEQLGHARRATVLLTAAIAAGIRAPLRNGVDTAVLRIEEKSQSRIRRV
jgi:RNA polymerase sigma factor (sigma-70 family)